MKCILLSKIRKFVPFSVVFSFHVMAVATTMRERIR